MLIGLIRHDRQLQLSRDVLREAALRGSVDGYPLGVLAQMLNVWKQGNPSASQIAGSTWRRTVLQAIIDYYAYPRSLLAMARGSMVHKGLQAVHFPDGVKVIKEKRLRCPLPSQKDIVVSGQIDVFFPEYRRLEDYKTCMSIPAHIKADHIFQLSVYYWLLIWSNYRVETVAIDYIAWDRMVQQTTVALPNGDVIEAINHPYFQDQEYFEQEVTTGYVILKEGFDQGVVPSMQYCNLNYCRYCPVKWACDDIAPRGETVDPDDFDQGEY